MMQIVNLLLPVVAVAAVFLLLRSGIRLNRFWRATITPLASIIGSGFLIVAPLLAGIAGPLAAYAMAAIVALAYAIGFVIRYNIRYAEPLLNEAGCDRGLLRLEQISRMALVLAYVVSITFYLRLMASFLLEGFDLRSDFLANALTTAVLLFIGITGITSGLRGLERLEIFSVSVKLSIIAALLFGLVFYAGSAGYDLGHLAAEPRPLTERLRMLAGMLLVVQGFETSRYLGQEYDTDTRISSMRLAQIIATVIYIVFVALSLPLLQYIEAAKPDETAIIALVGRVAPLLPGMLIIAATMSQFSAAVADMLGAGGLVVEQSRARIKASLAYLMIALVSILLVWTANIFEIIAFASRAFAAYYLLQTLLSIRVWLNRPAAGRQVFHLIALLVIATLLLAVVLFAVPVG